MKWKMNEWNEMKINVLRSSHFFSVYVAVHFNSIHICIVWNLTTTVATVVGTCWICSVQGRRKHSKSGGTPVFRGTLINKNWQLFKLQRGTLLNNLWKVGGTCPLCPPVPTSMVRSILLLIHRSLETMRKKGVLVLFYVYWSTLFIGRGR